MDAFLRDLLDIVWDFGYMSLFLQAFLSACLSLHILKYYCLDFYLFMRN